MIILPLFVSLRRFDIACRRPCHGRIRLFRPNLVVNHHFVGRCAEIGQDVHGRPAFVHGKVFCAHRLGGGLSLQACASCFGTGFAKNGLSGRKADPLFCFRASFIAGT
jgi:hypothetical protein